MTRYLREPQAAGQSSRGVIGAIRREIAAFARSRHRDNLAKLFTGPACKGPAAGCAMAAAVEQLRSAAAPAPLIGDGVDLWLAPRVAAVLRQAGIKTLAHLTLRVPRRRRWWVDIDGLGAAGARRIEAFFAAHADLTQRARALLDPTAPSDVVPWEKLVVPHEVNGTMGLHRTPRASCVLRANNDFEAVQAWLSLHEAPATQRAYRKETERLLLWAIVERGVTLSSLDTEDAVANRAFLRQPAPRQRWVGPASPRHASEWRPVRRWPVHALQSLCAVSGELDVSVADRAAVRAGQPVRQHQRPRRQAADAGHASLDAPHARAPCASERRRADDGARQPAARFLVDHVYVLALGRPSPGEADRWGVRGAGGVIGRGRSKRVNLHREYKRSARGGSSSACRG